MRFVQLHIAPEQMPAFEHLYERRLAPALRETPGCLFAGLNQSDVHPDECISMTLWNRPEDARTYEQSGLYKTLLQESDSHLADASEWRIQLSDDFTLQYKPG